MKRAPLPHRRFAVCWRLSWPAAACVRFTGPGANPGAQRIFASIYVRPIDLERVGYELRNELIDLLQADGSRQRRRYQLKVQ